MKSDAAASGEAEPAAPHGRPAPAPGPENDDGAAPVAVELAFADPGAAARLVRHAAWRRAATAAE